MSHVRTALFASVAILLSMFVTDHQVAAQGSSAPSAIGQLAQRLNPMNWKAPSWKMPSFKKMLPQQAEQDRIIQKKDGFLSEVGRTAKSSWKRTTSALNPMNVLPVGNRTPSKPPAAKKPGFFSRLFSPPPKADDMSTVSDFLRQDRVKP